MTPFRRPADLRFWLITLAAVVGMLVTASLGRWQLSRAAQKESLQAMLDARASQPAVDGRTLTDPASATPDAQQALVHRAVVLQGRWLPAHTVYLDNRQMQGRPGFFVLTPLQLSGGGAGVVLVQRGWVGRNFQDRTQLPSVTPPADTEVRVQGRVALAPSRLYEFQGAIAHRGLPASGKISTWQRSVPKPAWRSPPLRCCRQARQATRAMACNATGLWSAQASKNTTVTHFNGSGSAA